MPPPENAKIKTGYLREVLRYFAEQAVGVATLEFACVAPNLRSSQDLNCCSTALPSASRRRSSALMLCIFAKLIQPATARISATQATAHKREATASPNTPTQMIVSDAMVHPIGNGPARLTRRTTMSSVIVGNPDRCESSASKAKIETTNSIAKPKEPSGPIARYTTTLMLAEPNWDRRRPIAANEPTAM